MKHATSQRMQKLYNEYLEAERLSYARDYSDPERVCAAEAAHRRLKTAQGMARAMVAPHSKRLVMTSHNGRVDIDPAWDGGRFGVMKR